MVCFVRTCFPSRLLGLSLICISGLPVAAFSQDVSSPPKSGDLINSSLRDSGGRADDNAVMAAEDAFGSSIGSESIGLYSSSRVRGFSPVTAGNVRIDGVYVDRQGSISPRLADGSTVRVGLSAQGYPFPAPTGIIDYRLRKPGDEAIVSVLAGVFPYGAPTLEIDAQIPIFRGRLGMVAGASIAHEQYYDGTSARYINAAIITSWRPTDSIEVTPFSSAIWGHDEQAPPLIRTAGNIEPPRAPRRRAFGQPWATKSSVSENHGVIGKVRIGSSWAISGGAFRSIFTNNQNFANLFVETTADGTTRELVIADPEQRYASTSGEIGINRSLVDGPRVHTLHALIRARAVDSDYGGSTSPFDLGIRQLGEFVSVAEPPNFAFGFRTRDTVRQTMIGAAYDLRWNAFGEANFGIQRVDYRKMIAQPGEPETATQGRPWLFSAAGSLTPTSRLAFYAGYTRGLEESGIAPNNSANRNEALPAIRTRQADAGIRWMLNDRMKLVAGMFDVRKPYFNTDALNRFVVLGDVRHRGAELSFSGNPSDHLSLVLGAVLMEPRVTGEAVDHGLIGELPLGEPGRLVRGNVDWRPAELPQVSFDLDITNYSERAASRDNIIILPGYTIIDIGARYKFNINDVPMMVRFQIENLTDKYYYSILGSNTYRLTDGRRSTIFLAVDL
ncbi:TonB-dependent receptor [Qipengyuania flava]|nr:TonB-dependent receptor [Qipengyuania flava]